MQTLPTQSISSINSITPSTLANTIGQSASDLGIQQVAYSHSVDQKLENLKIPKTGDESEDEFEGIKLQKKRTLKEERKDALKQSKIDSHY